MTRTLARTLSRFFAWCLATVAFQVVLRANITGTILGTVRDASGSAMPNVTITVTNIQKITRLRESMSLQIRAEFFNALSTPTSPTLRAASRAETSAVSRALVPAASARSV